MYVRVRLCAGNGRYVENQEMLDAHAAENARLKEELGALRQGECMCNRDFNSDRKRRQTPCSCVERAARQYNCYHSISVFISASGITAIARQQ
jgi:hypothetical protein